MAPGARNERTDTPEPKSTKAKQSLISRRSDTKEVMDSSRTAQSTKAATSSSPEPATAAMIDVSSWAQRGLVLENKDLRRTLEMTKSAHSAQLAQIAKRQKTEKEELEVKLEAEMCRQQAQQRSLHDLAANLEDARQENAKLIERDQALHKQLLIQIEENKRLEVSLKEAENIIRKNGDEIDAMQNKQEELTARESRVAMVLNDQHNKILTLSQAYHKLETDNDRLRADLKAANGELTRVKARMSGILGTLAKVMQDNGDEAGIDGGIFRKVSRHPENHSPQTVTLGRQRARESNRPSSVKASPNSPHFLDAGAGMSTGPGIPNEHQGFSIHKNTEDSLNTDLPVNQKANADLLQVQKAVDIRGKSVRTKRRRIVSDSESAHAEKHPIADRIKQEPAQADASAPDSAAVSDGEDRATPPEETEVIRVGGVDQSMGRVAGVGAKNLDAGEDSPERAAVESAIDVRDESQNILSMQQETERAAGKPQPTTYAKKRKAPNNQQIASDRPETPMSEDRPDSNIHRSLPAAAFSTPTADRSKTSPNQHSSYVTRSKIAKSVGIASDPATLGSPHSRKRPQSKISKEDAELRTSVDRVQVKEEVSDTMFDGLPRITGGDDEDDPLWI